MTSQLDLESSIDQKDETELFSFLKFSNDKNEMLTLIDEFFNLTEAFERETEMANKIKKAYKRMKLKKTLRMLKKSVFQLLGYRTHIEQLPNELIIYTLSFLTKKELYIMSQVNRDFNDAAFDQSLWTSYQLKNQKKTFKLSKVLPKIILKLQNLRVLNFSFCASIDENAIQKLSPFVNKGTLKELYLDGCEKVNDNALSILTGRDPTHLQVDQNLLRDEAALEENPLAIRKSKGLELLSLSECRNIHCSGIMKLDKLQNLRTLNLLGCVSVKDEGIIYLNKHNDRLETLNLAGTSITSECVYFIVREGAISLRNVNIVGCKKLKTTDQELLKSNGFNVKGGEDVFRFNLLPEPFSGLKKITQSVLKTRSTLSIYRVYKYLAKRLINDLNLLPPDFPESHIDHDEFVSKLNIEIHCRGEALKPHYQLKYVFEKYWDSEDLLTLYYRSKVEEVDHKSLFHKEWNTIPSKPPIWIPDYIAYNCYQCDKDFSMLNRIHHCRACGKCFCHSCSKYKIALPNYGYFDPVRVCSECYSVNHPDKYKELIDDLSHRNTNSIIYEAAAELSIPRIVVSPQWRGLHGEDALRLL